MCLWLDWWRWGTDGINMAEVLICLANISLIFLSVVGICLAKVSLLCLAEVLICLANVNWKFWRRLWWFSALVIERLWGMIFRRRVVCLATVPIYFFILSLAIARSQRFCCSSPEENEISWEDWWNVMDMMTEISIFVCCFGLPCR